MRPFLLLAAAAAALWCWEPSLHVCHAQRAAVSAGSKLTNDDAESAAGRSRRRDRSRRRASSSRRGADGGAEEESDGESSSSNRRWRWPWRLRRRSEESDDRRSTTTTTTSSDADDPTAGVVLAALLGALAVWNAREDDDDDDRIAVRAEEIEIEDEAHLDRSDFLHRVEIGFEGIRMTLAQRGDKPDRLILDGSIRGRALPGRMLAVMGPSGSGKSTFLHSIAGRVKENRRIDLYGRRYLNGAPLSGDSEIPAAFVEQETNYFPHMTVKETLDFRVELKLGRTLGKSARDDVVADLMDQLSLTKSAHTIVGNSKIRGLSGGERRRLSIACEMISSPPVIFLDEPTSGLDSFQAAQVVETLRKLADSGKTIVAVIHQPSQHVFSMFDDLLLLSEGRQMYFGEVKDVRPYLDKLGFTCEREVGTAEHVLDCISRVSGNGDGDAERKSEERIEKLAKEAIVHSKEITVFPEPKSGAKKSKMKHFAERIHRSPAVSIFRQFKLLLSRALQEAFRGKGAIAIKVVQQVSLGVIYGGIYHLGNNQASIMDRFGLLSLIVIGATNMAMAGTIRSFPKEKAIVSAEMSSNLFGTLPYFISKAMSEIPLLWVFNAIFGSIIYPLTGLQRGNGKFKTFLALTSLHSIASEAAGLLVGSISSSSDVALALFPPIVVLNIIFDGKNISEENTPRLLRWIPKVGLIRWGFEGLAINEFEGLEFTSSFPPRGPVAKTGDDALARFGLQGRTVADVFRAQTRIIASCWLLSYLGLSLTRQRFEVMMSPHK